MREVQAYTRTLWPQCECGVRDQLSGVSYLLPPQGIQGLNLDHQACPQAPLPTGPSHQPGLCISNKHYKWLSLSLSEINLYCTTFWEIVYREHWCMASWWTLTKVNKQAWKWETMDIQFFAFINFVFVCTRHGPHVRGSQKATLWRLLSPSIMRAPGIQPRSSSLVEKCLYLMSRLSSSRSETLKESVNTWKDECHVCTCVCHFTFQIGNMYSIFHKAPPREPCGSWWTQMQCFS